MVAENYYEEFCFSEGFDAFRCFFDAHIANSEVALQSIHDKFPGKPMLMTFSSSCFAVCISLAAWFGVLAFA